MDSIGFVDLKVRNGTFAPSQTTFMRILLLGATGRTGKLLLRQALDRGHIVQALVRDRRKVAISHPRLFLFEGSPLDKDKMLSAMQGCEAVLSALNVSRKSDWPWAALASPRDLLSRSMSQVAQLGPGAGIRRVVFVSAWGVAETKKEIPGWFRWLIDHSHIRYPYQDHARQEEIIQASSLSFTSVRPAGLTNSKKTGGIVVSVNRQPKPHLLISRAAVAAFMLDVLEKNLYDRQMVVISQK